VQHLYELDVIIFYEDFVDHITAHRGGPEALAFWPGLGLRDGQARLKAMLGQNFGLALASVPKPKSHGFLA
jgi:hypothetical protein